MSRVLIEIGPITIYWYSFLIVLALLIGSFLAEREAKRLGYLSLISDLLFGTVIFSIIGARLYYVIFNYSIFQNNFLDIFKIWEGGLAIYGAIIGGVIYIAYFSIKNSFNILTILDILAPSLILGQALGRWGNFFNQEAYGIETTLESLQKLHIPEFIINNMYINGVYYTPTFLYESIWCIIGLIILLVLRKKLRSYKGLILSIYMIWYGIGRFFIEGVRTDSLYLGTLRISQLVSIAFVIIGIILIIYNVVRKKELYEKV